MNAHSVFVNNSHFIKGNQNPHILKNGSQVLVRITAEIGKNKYEGFVGGAKIILNGGKTGKLEIGSSFIANLKLENGKLQVIPKNTSEIFNVDNKFLVEVQNQESFLMFMENNGIIPDDISFHLLQQFKQMEMKIDANLLNKLRNTAVKFKGKEKSIGELLVLLMQKKISYSEEDLLELLEELSGNFNENQVYEEDSEEKNHQKEKEHFKLVNKINSIKGKWYLFPYEIVKLGEDNTADNNQIGNGSIRMMLDDNEDIKIVNLLCNYFDKKYLFSLIFENKNLKNIRMNISPACENFEIWKDEKIRNIKQMFMNKNINVEVSWCDEDELSGSCCSNEEFYKIDGKI